MSVSFLSWDIVSRPRPEDRAAATRVRRQVPASITSPRQYRRSHQEFVDCTGALAAFADGPYHQRLTAAHVPGGVHLGYGSRVTACAIRRRARIAARVGINAKGFEHRLHG